MLWQIEFSSRFDNSERLEEQLSSLGIETVSYLPIEGEDDYQVNPGEAPAWKHCTVQLHLADDQQLDQFLLFVQANAIDELTLESLHISPLEEKNWQTNWQKHWKPSRFGKLIVCSSESQPTLATDDLAVYINPGLAFGTGTHETTALCLHWLSEHKLQQKKVLDYGSGSGILAIAAARMGCTDVIAYDHDPQAITASQDNSDLNDMTAVIAVVDSEKKVKEKEKYDVILANIMLAPLIELVEALHGLLKETGTLVVSGILEQQKEVLLSAWHAKFQEISCQKKNEWLMLCFQPITNTYN